jgi:hypothetical protein
MFVGIGNVEIHGNACALFGLIGNRMGATH